MDFVTFARRKPYSDLIRVVVGWQEDNGRVNPRPALGNSRQASYCIGSFFSPFEGWMCEGDDVKDKRISEGILEKVDEVKGIEEQDKNDEKEEEEEEDPEELQRHPESLECHTSC
ncbi:hypothetical protein PIB30_054432 [Stylosanthes scabra]|uniref:Uncharacterized protein n=1 Tax=Stylosanthes scabra TaxID=79078 RepID=A0ABU6QJ53_9FABA|nr:hypothetical protein [Stylosanthes scabra]